nr:unnamed protein product [Callosobruchus analis]
MEVDIQSHKAKIETCETQPNLSFIYGASLFIAEGGCLTASRRKMDDKHREQLMRWYEDWCETTTRSKSAVEVFECILTREVNNYIVQKSNEYGDLMLLNNRPKSRNERFKTFQQISLLEMKGFLGLCLLAGQLKFRSIRDMFSLDPLNYHPIFPATMSGRRFEQILRCLNCSNNENNDDNLYKVSWLVKAIVKSSQNMFSPPEALSLDESLLLFRGRLKFRVYITNEKVNMG